MITEIMELEFGQVRIFQNILIAELTEGVLFNANNNSELLKIGHEVFKNRPYGYISLRKNSYAVDPLVYREAALAENLKAIAVVSENELIKLNAHNVERQFYKDSGSFEVFDSLEEAINWIQFRI
ncbi:hypothetical protein [Salegentibacter mishustinae]|uniref:STAS/SEC14 domain-containing protein n=1 Tax=Salegentibacter mishustinae TaxID=270918 RepID=A0A0Q9ZKI2_9FLAO|nr:hypothetical protein [Salegentibacter mishustinae]KRG29271.1 hypothetical protein APR42_04870 [Salegentibacter mishustinae]PNW21681.1 hypothetical protein APB85_10620 [Salegentibacter mishustinae]PZX65021.1 hypothetical protein LY54_01313 [Salegentibacter mishustinae]GGW87810.1 hypothetical protein GCM10008086_15610 [Salegentibacter mishustinae]